MTCASDGRHARKKRVERRLLPTPSELFVDIAACSLSRNSVLLCAATKTKHKVEGRLLLDVIVGQSATVFKLLASKDQALLIWWNAFLVLDLGLDIVNGVAGLDIEGDGL